MAFAWDPAKDSATPTWTYGNSDRDVRHNGGNYPAFGTDDCEFDSDPAGDGVVFSILLDDVSSGSPNGNATFGFCDSTQADDDQISDFGITYTRSGVLYADGSLASLGLPTIAADDEIVFGIKNDELQWLVVGGVEVIAVADTVDHVAFTNKTDYVPMCNPRLSSGTANWRLNTLATDIGETIPSGFAALESAGGGPDALTPDDLTSGTPSLDSPALGQEHALTPDDLTAGTPTLSQPVLAEPGAASTDLAEWRGGTTTLLPTTTWAAPNALFSGTATRNDNTAYSFTSSTSTITLPSADLADGYLVIGAFEFEDTSNGRHNPQGRFTQASGTGDFISGASTGYNRDASEDRSYVRTWAFIDNPSASATIQFQWRRDSDSPTGGTVRSQLQVIPLYYSNHGIYSSASNTCTGGTTVNQLTGFTADAESDTAAIEISSNVVTVKGDNKRYLVLASQYWQGIGNARTQRWHGLRVDSTLQDDAKGYSYGRNSTNADIGEMFTTLVETATANKTIDQIVYRGEAVGAFPNSGGDVDGNTTGSNASHAMVVLELHDNAEVFRSRSNTQQDIDAAGTRVDLQIADEVDFNDAASFTDAGTTGIQVEQDGDFLLGANVSGGYASSSTARYTGYAEFTIDGVGETYSVAGDYGRGDQSTTDCWGWSANLMGFVAANDNEDLGVDAGKITGGEGGTVDTLADWVGFWGINISTLPLSGSGTDALTPDDLTAGTPSLDSPAITQTHDLTGDDVTAGTPALDSPALGQEHALTADDLAGAAPTLGTPALAEVHALAADDIAAGAPALDSPAIGQVHAFAAVEVSTSPTVDETAIGQTHDLTATDLTTTPVLDNPTLGQEHALAATDLIAGTPTLSSPVVTQAHALTGTDLSTTPTLDSPTLGQEHALTVDDVLAGTPVLDTPVLGIVGVTHNLTADDIATGVPVLGSPVLAIPGIGGGGAEQITISIGIGL